MRLRFLAAAALAVSAGLVPLAGNVLPAGAATSVSLCPGANVAAFGPNVCVFSDTMSQTTIQADLDPIATQQVPSASQFDDQRYAVFFQPGTYGSAANPLVFQVGYYTQVAGLGRMPQDTVVNGAIDVFNNLCTAGTSDCNSDVNFWRSLSNLTLNVDLPSSPPAYAPPPGDPFGTGCTNSAEMWSVSQAAPIRRAIINGSVVFQDYCANNNFASGGFIADSEVSGHLNFNGNQQYLVRNSTIGGASGCPNGLWNMVYAGVKGAPAPVFTGQCQQNTVLPATSVTEEEPFLYTDPSGGFRVFVPAVQHDSSGPSWASGSEAGTSVPLSRFFVASPDTPVAAINGELALGRDLILTPGVYNLDQPILVSRPDTVVLSQGYATLVPQRGNAAMVVLPSVGVKLSGLLIDAGPVRSPVLLSVGTPGLGSAGNPDVIQDVFFRVGGAETTPVAADVSLLDNADHSIIDDVWAWRADHGNAVGWTSNVGATGVVVTGSDVTSYGLAVEHYQKDEVIWRGQGGSDVFFQNELPYDPPSQAAWMASPSQDGYPAFLVSPGVRTFQGYGMGSYVVFIQTSATLFDASAFQAPSAPGVQFHDVFGVWIAGAGGLNSVINGVGGPVTSTNPGTVEPVDVVTYP
ncbi:MAG: adenylyl cyclase [Streptosporangiaceae bacterium]|nr:adenylyl cyclase [Streptosporangiaceae bacterium]